jgi:hypothetical protein
MAWALLHVIYLAFLPNLAAAFTTQTPQCDIIGDPDVYGPGIRYGLYLQWASFLLFLFFCPEKANIGRSATAITTLAVYINFFRNSHNKTDLVSLEWILLSYISTALIVTNIPTTTKSFKKSGDSVALIFIIFAVYFISALYVFFTAWNYGRKPGCDVKIFFFVPINVYSRGWTIAVKVLFTLFALGSIVIIILAFVILIIWLAAWIDPSVARYHEETNWKYYTLGAFSTAVGIPAIVFAEKTIEINNVIFQNTHLVDSGQLIPLIIGIFTLCSAVLNSLRELTSGGIDALKIKHGAEFAEEAFSLLPK